MTDDPQPTVADRAVSAVRAFLAILLSPVTMAFLLGVVAADAGSGVWGVLVVPAAVGPLLWYLVKLEQREGSDQ